MFQLLRFVNKYSFTGRISKQENGTVSHKHLLLQYNNIIPFSTIDSGLGFLYSREFPSSKIVHLQPSLNIYVSFFKPEINNFTEPLIIYQTSISNLTMENIFCTTDVLSVFKCMVHLRKTTSTDQLNVTSYNLLLSISFHSSGSVTNIEEILDRDYVNADDVGYMNLYYGGYFLAYANVSEEGCLLGGNIYDNNNKLHSPLFIPKEILLPFPCIVWLDYDQNLEMITKITPNNFTNLRFIYLLK